MFSLLSIVFLGSEQWSNYPLNAFDERKQSHLHMQILRMDLRRNAITLFGANLRSVRSMPVDLHNGLRLVILQRTQIEECFGVERNVIAH